MDRRSRPAVPGPERAVRGGVFALPDLGEGLTEAEIVEWRVAIGDTVDVDQVVVVVETAKAAVEVPVPFAGVVAAIHAQAGDVVLVDEPLISVDLTESTPDEGGASSAVGTSGNVLVGYGTSQRAASRRRRAWSVPEVVQLDVDGAPVVAPATRVISPLVRRQAAIHGIDVATVVPSGRGGVVVRRDVEAAIAGRVAPPTASAGPAWPAGAAAAPAGTAGDGPACERIALRGTRRAVADKMSRSRSEIPEVTTWVDADATGLLVARDALRAAGHSVSVIALVGRICVAGLRRFGELNASVDVSRAEIVRHRDIHLGFATQTAQGLVVPVVHDAQDLSTTQLAAELTRLTGLARAGRLARRDLTGGTFTLNNYGVFGVDGATPIINHPEAALVGIGRIAEKPWVHEGVVAVRKVVQLSLTFDHRVGDGATAGGYLRFVADCVQDPIVLLADL
jgi:2-oxoisovalerate dehydrogenase E2 component (dihydrolipoyl transacylase)